ncbi:MAG: Fe-S-binding domain-containing protein, partial [Acidobacteria bacterium]|nr:Fe-S-binding domain-containing protein [Acidobacteriota bacterium]
FIYERRHTRLISEYGGLSGIMPIYATLFVITTMASIGLPFLNGFVGEFLIMLGMWTSVILPGSMNKIAAMFAGTGVIFAAVYLLWMVQRVFFGKVTNEKNRGLLDLSAREIGLMIPLLVLMVLMGVYPKPILESSKESIVAIQKRVIGETKGGTITELKTETKESH